MTSSPTRVLPVGLVVLVGIIAACGQGRPSAMQSNELAPEPNSLEQLLAGRVSGASSFDCMAEGRPWPQDRKSVV